MKYELSTWRTQFVVKFYYHLLSSNLTISAQLLESLRGVISQSLRISIALSYIYDLNEIHRRDYGLRKEKYLLGT